MEFFGKRILHLLYKLITRYIHAAVLVILLHSFVLWCRGLRNMELLCAQPVTFLIFLTRELLHKIHLE